MSLQPKSCQATWGSFPLSQHTLQQMEALDELIKTAGCL